MVNLTRTQYDLLQRLHTSYEHGLSATYIDTFRNNDDSDDDTPSRSHSASSASSTINQIRPPINCPKWICCLLPCIKHMPSMKQFRIIQPTDAEVLRSNEWVLYDATSLMVGDIIRVREGDRIPADCELLTLGEAHYSLELGNERGKEEDENKDVNGVRDLEMVVDLEPVNGSKPRTVQWHHVKKATAHTSTSSGGVALLYGGLILHGSGIAVVTAIGQQTVLAKSIQCRRWPPSPSGVTIVSEKTRGKEGQDEDATGDGHFLLSRRDEVV